MSQYQRIRLLAVVIAGLLALISMGNTDIMHPNPVINWEKVEIVNNGYIRITDEPSGWVIKLWMKNSHPYPNIAIISSLIINSEPIPESNYGATGITLGEIYTSIPDTETGVIIEGGKTEIISIYVSDANITVGSHVSMNILIHSKNGNDYYKNFNLYKSPS